MTVTVTVAVTGRLLDCATVKLHWHIGWLLTAGLTAQGPGFYETMPTTAFWLMHTGFAAFSLAVFVLFKIFMGRRLVGPESG